MGVLEQPQSLQQVLRAAFLRGEKVVATRFAQQHGFSRQGVSDGLRVMQRRGLVVSRELPTVHPRMAPIEFSCADVAAMEAYRPKIQTHNPMLSRRRVVGPFSALLDAWGIRHVDIRLPAMRHSMMHNEAEV